MSTRPNSYRTALLKSDNILICILSGSLTVRSITYPCCCGYIAFSSLQQPSYKLQPHCHDTKFHNEVDLIVRSRVLFSLKMEIGTKQNFLLTIDSAGCSS